MTPDGDFYVELNDSYDWYELIDHRSGEYPPGQYGSVVQFRAPMSTSELRGLVAAARADAEVQTSSTIDHRRLLCESAEAELGISQILHRHG